MTPRDIFGIIIRAAGLFILRLSLWLFYDYTYWFYTPNAGMSAYAEAQKVSDPKIYLVWCVGYLALGLYLLAGAPHLLRLSYPEPEAPESKFEDGEKEDA
jgi:hypothetical protein